MPQLSQDGALQLVDLEGCPTKAYPDVGGVMTIGPGFTNLSAEFKAYWIKTRGHKLQAGDVLPRSEAVKLLPLVFDAEYGKAVIATLGENIPQHVYDGAGSAAYNMGKGGLKWKWAIALRNSLNAQSEQGRLAFMADACARLLTTAITAAGRVYEGLKKRRRIEVGTIRDGKYVYAQAPAGQTPNSESTEDRDVRIYQQQLKDLGYYSGDVDGLRGKLTRGAVENFQRANGLKVDGKVGPATRARLQRALEAKVRNQGGVVVGGATGTGSVAVQPEVVNSGLDSMWQFLLYGSIALAIVFVAFALWSNRGKLLGQRTPA